MARDVYAHITVTEEMRQTAIDMIKDGKYSAAADYLKSISKEIHIGRFLCGYRFKFGRNPEFYNVERIESIKAFLSRPEVQMTEECIGPVTADEFWKRVDDCKNDRVERNYDNKVTADGINYKDCPADDWFC